LAGIEAAIEGSGADIDFELQPGGVLELEFADGSKIIVNRHGVAREIWVAARSGGFHFRHDGSAWRDTRDGAELMEKLSALASRQAGEDIRLA
jgi:CyaY protein